MIETDFVGKTSLLDALGSTNLLATDVEGVTQTVRTQCVPFSVASGNSNSNDYSSPEVPEKRWATFVDTPGQVIMHSAIINSIVCLNAMSRYVRC